MGTLPHFAAFFSALTAGIGAPAAMVHMMGMFFTLCSAGFTEMGAELANISQVLTITGHERNRHITNLGTIAIKPDAVDHHRNVLFAKAGFRAGITCYGTGLAGIDAGLVG